MFLQLRYRRKQRRIQNSQTSKIEYFAKIVNCHKPLTIFTKCSILDISVFERVLNMPVTKDDLMLVCKDAYIRVP